MLMSNTRSGTSATPSRREWSGATRGGGLSKAAQSAAHRFLRMPRCLRWGVGLIPGSEVVAGRCRGIAVRELEAHFGDRRAVGAGIPEDRAKSTSGESGGANRHRHPRARGRHADELAATMQVRRHQRSSVTRSQCQVPGALRWHLGAFIVKGSTGERSPRIQR